MGANRRLSDALWVALTLATVGGFLDAYTYLFRGGVFANGQTGNLVLLGLSAARRDWQGAFFYLLPIVAFVLGVLIAAFARIWISDAHTVKWRHVILAIEIALLVFVLFIPQGRLDQGVNIAISFVCALQTQSFRSLRGKPYISVMCTGNLRSLAESLVLYAQSRDRAQLSHVGEYGLVVVFFIVGALAGGILLGSMGGWALLAAIALLCVVLLALFLHEPIRAYCAERGIKL